jgi:hypothetical protein
MTSPEPTPIEHHARYTPDQPTRPNPPERIPLFIGRHAAPPSPTDPEAETGQPWWADHRNLALTAEFMSRQEDNPERAIVNVIYLLQKPWKHGDDFNLASAEMNLDPELWNREQS